MAQSTHDIPLYGFETEQKQQTMHSQKSSTVSSIHKSALGATENSFAGRCACAIAPSLERYHEICKRITLIHSHFFLFSNETVERGLCNVHCRPQLAP